MTVGELIEKLKQYPLDMNVEIDTSDGEYGPSSPDSFLVDEMKHCKPYFSDACVRTLVIES